MNDLEKYETDLYEDKACGFYLVSSIYEIVNRLEENRRNKMLTAIIEYGLYDKQPTWDNIDDELLFQSFMSQIVYGKKRSEKCRKNALKRKITRESNKYTTPTQTLKIDTKSGEIKEVKQEKKVSVW